MLNLPEQLRCPECQNPISLSLDEITDAYFHSPTYTHLTCGNALTWQQVIRWNLMTYRAVPALIESNSLTGIIEMQASKSIILNFGEYGVPNNARILGVGFHEPEFNLSIMELKSGQPYTRYHEIPREIELFAIPSEDLEDQERKFRVFIDILWVSDAGDNASLSQLINACDWYFRGYLIDVIIPANVAIEATLGKFLTTFLLGYRISRDRVEKFLSDGATYSYQLNVLLPLVARFFNAPELSSDIIGQLNRLRGKRNELAHGGTLTDPITEDDCTNMLVAVLVGYIYLSKVLPAHILRTNTA